MEYLPDTLLISEDEIQNRVSEIAAEISREYADQDLLVIGILKGSVFFATDLVRRIDNPLLEMDWTTVSSYGAGTRTSGVIRVLADTDISIMGRNVLIVDDICDSGLTLSWMARHMLGKGAKSVEAAVLIRKKMSMSGDFNAKYVGFDLGDEYVVGYGMDFNQRFRQLRNVYRLDVGDPSRASSGRR